MFRELKRPAVLGDVADEFFAGSVGEFGLDFEGDFYLGVGQAGEVLDDFFRDPGGVAAEPEGVDGDGAVEAAKLGRRGRG